MRGHLKGDMAAGRFLFVGNHPSLDFINTEMMQEGKRVDLLRTFMDVVAWMEQAALLTRAEARSAREQWAGRPEAEHVLQDLRAFRSEVRHMIDRICAGRPVPESTLGMTNRWLRQRVGFAQVVRSAGGYVRRYHREHEGVGHFLGLLAETVADLLSSIDLSRIKRCRNDRCILYFFDSTKNQTRRWCCMSLCGNRIKVAAHYRRKRRR
jgi:predicted RNA-binding Zn ribbon-like protein